MVRSWLRGVRWSGTASALAAVIALFGATAVASSLVADGQPDPASPSSVAASLASASTDRPTPTSVRVATTSVERRPVPPPTTSTTTTTEVLELPSASGTTTIVSLDVGADAVVFGTSADPSAACAAVALWSVPRVRPEATVVVSEDGLRLEEREPATGEVLGVLAAWDEAAGRPAGEGVTEAGTAPGPGGGCAPEDPATDAPTTSAIDG